MAVYILNSILLICEDKVTKAIDIMIARRIFRAENKGKQHAILRISWIGRCLAKQR